MGKKIYYIADLHFGHKNAIRFDERPFEDVEAMNEALICNWNERVGKDDIVYVLGDVFWKGADSDNIIRRLKGHKHIVFLREIVKRQPKIIFKGVTSLSKCYHLINRFSEDIDLNIESEQKPTEGQRKNLVGAVRDIVTDFGFVLKNPDKHPLDFVSSLVQQNVRTSRCSVCCAYSFYITPYMKRI